MPMHDWTRVAPNDYHDFHFAWIAAIRQALNMGRLPPEYFAPDPWNGTEGGLPDSERWRGILPQP